LPNAITLDQTTIGSEQLKIVEADTNAAAIYTIQIKAIDQKTLIESDVISFELIVRLRATNLVLVAGTSVNDLTYLVSDPAASLPVPEYEVLPINANTQCFHALGASTPSFVTLVGSPYGSPIIQILTTDVAKTGVYSIDVTYTDEFSGIQKTDTFILTISCVRVIAPTATLNDVNYWITDSAIAREPVFELTPAGCPNELVFEVTQTGGVPLPGSITFDSTYGLEKIIVFETDYALTAVY